MPARHFPAPRRPHSTYFYPGPVRSPIQPLLSTSQAYHSSTHQKAGLALNNPTIDAPLNYNASKEITPEIVRALIDPTLPDPSLPLTQPQDPKTPKGPFRIADHRLALANGRANAQQAKAASNQAIYEEHHNSFLMVSQTTCQTAALYIAVFTAAAAPEHGSPPGQVPLSALTYQPRNGTTVFTCNTE
jgi:hypothetical protein